MEILYIHSLMFQQRTWQRVADRLADDGVILGFADQASAVTFLDGRETKDVDLLIAELTVGLPDYEVLLNRGFSIRRRIGLSPEMPAEFTTVSAHAVDEFKQYLSAVSADNYFNGIRLLAAHTGMDLDYDPPISVLTTGIYHPEAPQPFDDVGLYRAWLTIRLPEPETPWIGLLFYYNQLIEENTAEVDAVILALESHGLAPLCVFSAGAEDAMIADPEGPAWLGYFQQSPGIEVLLSFMAGRLLKTTDQIDLLKRLDVPIFQLLRTHGRTPDQWRDDPQGLPGMTAIYSLSQPELFGVAAPVMVAGSTPPQSNESAHGQHTFIPIDERIHTLCRRVQRRVQLRRLANRDKRITIVLHNNPCKGVEATVGMAMGLDTFDSLALLLQRMGHSGYDIGRAPTSGSKILETIMNRKAICEFRWTTVDEIVTQGGDLYRMDGEEYIPWFDRLPETARRKVLDDWDEFPGQGMVFRENGKDRLVITGIQYGNIRIMVQPKRGCYGPKCTGEVCRILHDPQLSPPHHWLAVYKYIRENSDAVVHFGTGGSLEFLPGKQAGLCNACFPEISIGDLPNMYVYAVDVTGEGLTAKRRGQATLVDHLTPVYRPAPMNDTFHQLEILLDQHRQAKINGDTERLFMIEKSMRPLLVQCDLVEEEPDTDTLAALIPTFRRRIQRMKQALMPEGLHRLSTPPGTSGTAKMLATLLRTPPPGLPNLETVATWAINGKTSAYDRATAVLEDLLEGRPINSPGPHLQKLSDFCVDFARRIAGCRMEIDQLLHGLNGGFIAPGLSGSPNNGKIEALPTGRNFFATDVTTLPTPAAWEVGKQMADQLLYKYHLEEGRFPESIGISIWSSDAFKSDGELLCQILHLMGARPVWDNQGRVRKTVPIDLKELAIPLSSRQRLPRPRVDVTIQTSSLMRDLVPNFCKLLDHTVTLLSRLDEPDEHNYIRKHTREQMQQLRDRTDEKISNARAHRMATLRIFSSAPGTYSLGVGLAIDASAWQEAKDLAEVYINWGGHAYAYDDTDIPSSGIEARQLLADQLSRIDVAYMKQTSAEHDLLDCGCYAVSQGGMATAAAAVGNKNPKLYWGDSTTPSDAHIDDLSDAIQRSARTKLLNPSWIEYMRDHGYQGTQSVADIVNTLFKWSATSGEVSKRLFDDIVQTYLVDEKNRDWLRIVNPYAFEEITRRLLEAASRGMWAADSDLLSKVQHCALEIEGDMEETMGEVNGEFQGGKVEVLTNADVKKWKMAWRIGDR